MKLMIIFFPMMIIICKNLHAALSEEDNADINALRH